MITYKKTGKLIVLVQDGHVTWEEWKFVVNGIADILSTEECALLTVQLSGAAPTPEMRKHLNEVMNDNFVYKKNTLAQAFLTHDVSWVTIKVTEMAMRLSVRGAYPVSFFSELSDAVDWLISQLCVFDPMDVLEYIEGGYKS